MFTGAYLVTPIQKQFYSTQCCLKQKKAGGKRKTVEIRVKTSMHQRNTIAQNVERMKQMKKKTRTKSIRIKIGGKSLCSIFENLFITSCKRMK